MRRIIGGVVLMLGLTMLTTVVTTAPSDAAIRKETKLSRTFIQSKEWKSVPLKRCFFITVVGTIKATYVTNGRARWIEEPRIINPRMTVSVKKTCGGAAAKVTKLELRQYYYDRKCKVQPSLSAGASTSGALSIGISATRICNDFQTGYRASTYGKADRYTQNTSGADVMWDKQTNWNFTEDNKYHEVCVTGEVEAQPYLGPNADDLLRYTFKDICISKAFAEK